MTPAPGPPPLVATYRLQLRREFDFADAMALVPYLADLGISHLYLSPVLQAVPGSTHGYDACDPTRLSDDLGGEAGFQALAAAARAHGLGVVLDIVPNHMATSAHNPWWWELLRDGRAGARGAFFDVDWDDPDPELHGRVLLPVLGSPLAECLARGELELRPGAGGPELAYGDHRFPLSGDLGGRGLGENLDRQHYLLADWREALRRLNYRRFFAIDSLVALREEDAAVFREVHGRVLDLVRDGSVQGLRVDHVDGLRNPAAYLDHLRAGATDAWLLVEKILEPGESLPDGWPVAGTTGYDFIHRLTGVLIDPAGEAVMTTLYEEFTGTTATYAEVVLEAKRDAATRLFAPDLARLARILVEHAQDRGLEVDAAAAAAVLLALAVRLPVYRTYLPDQGEAAPTDRERIAKAASAARGDADPKLVDVLVQALLERGDPAAVELAQRFQQLSGPLMAKGVEDTAYYRYNRLLCLNEVGGDPGTFGVSASEFHRANGVAATSRPSAILASSTHDTKRSEDVRARLALLAQVPGEWADAVHRWSAINQRHWSAGVVDRETEYVLYQALVGAWPISEERVQAFVEKACREAAVRTTWVEPDAGYEAAVRRFVSGVMADPAFLHDFERFIDPLIEPGRIAALAHCLLKLTSPGVPDIYQGNEAWDLSLVDPDNRRPVDYALRRDLLEVSARAAVDPAIDVGDFRWDDGLAKVHVVRQALALRRRQPAAFAPGSTYTPLVARGAGADHVVGFARGTADRPMAAITLVPRLVLGRDIDWDAVEIEVGPGQWRDVLWGGETLQGPVIRVGEVFARHTIGLLEQRDGG